MELPTREARKAKRAVKRAERKSQAAPSAMPALASSLAAERAAAPSSNASSGSSSASAHSAGQLHQAATPSGVGIDEQHRQQAAALEELFLLNVLEPELPINGRAAALTPKASVLTVRKPAVKRAVVFPSPLEEAADATEQQQAAADDSVAVHAAAAATTGLHAGSMQQRAAPHAQAQASSRAAAFAPSASRAASSSAPASILDASALVSRSAGQVAVMQAGPSLLSLAPAPPATHLPGGTSAAARTRHSRRSAAHGHGGSRSTMAEAAAPELLSQYSGSDGISMILNGSANMMDVEVEKEVTEVCRDFLLLEKVKRQCARTLQREASNAEVAAAIGMDSR
jgi:hypothetical protein